MCNIFQYTRRKYSSSTVVQNHFNLKSFATNLKCKNGSRHSWKRSVMFLSDLKNCNVVTIFLRVEVKFVAKFASLNIPGWFPGMHLLISYLMHGNCIYLDFKWNVYSLYYFDLMLDTFYGQLKKKCFECFMPFVPVWYVLHVGLCVLLWPMGDHWPPRYNNKLIILIILEKWHKFVFDRNRNVTVIT